jgi:Pyruvate/2-oxoacid:ferredoxin oxidoreductase gamma subunit
MLGNLVLVGALSKVLGLPSLRSLERAVLEELPEVRARVRGAAALKAVQLGYGLEVGVVEG